MKTHKGRVSLAVAANHIALSARAFNFLIEAGVIPRQAPNVGYDLDEVRVRYIKNLRLRASGQGDGLASLAKARALLAQQQTETASIRNAVARGEFVAVADVVGIHTNELSTIREAFLSLPGKESDALSDGDEARRAFIEERLRGAVIEILENLSDSTQIAGHAIEMGKRR